MTDERFTLIKNLRLLDAAAGRTDGCDLLFSVKNKKSRILAIGKNLALPEGGNGTLIKAHGKLVCPAFTDLRCRIPDPGLMQKDPFASAAPAESLTTGLFSACAGGYGEILLTPCAKAAPDTPERVRTALDNCKTSSCKVRLAVPMTQGGKGEKLCELDRLFEAGASAVSAESFEREPDAATLLEALRFTGQRGALFIAPAGDRSLDGAGAVNKGGITRFTGSAGIEPLSEVLALSRALILAEETGAPVHFPMITLKKSVETVRKAKEAGVQITCATAPPYFSYNESEVLLSGSNAKLLPPLRREEDRMAVVEGLADGTIDCIVSDHDPHTAAEKAGGIEKAAFGATGFETAFGAGITHLVLPEYLSIYRLIELMAIAPAKLLGKDASIREGGPCDLLFIDPDAEMVYGKNSLRSRSANTPFGGRSLRGRVTAMFADGVRQF